MKILAYCMCIVLLTSGCAGWAGSVIPYNPTTPAPSRTPSIQTATPIILSPAPITATEATSTGAVSTDSPTATLVTITPTETLTPTLATPVGAIGAQILGCDTSIDIVHGMGEVTNAYVRITNTISADVPNVCATLRALDEGRPHPDKTKCLPSLPAGYQVTFKLTVDSTYKENSPVQVDITSNDSLVLRVGEPACTAIGVLPPDIDGLGTPQPSP